MKEVQTNLQGSTGKFIAAQMKTVQKLERTFNADTEVAVLFQGAFQL